MAEDETTNAERQRTPPFLLKLFYRTGAFHRPDEFASTSLPEFLTIYTWHDATLAELSHHLANHQPSLLPSPSIGTRLAFRLVFREKASSRFVVEDLGSVVLGGGDPDIPSGIHMVDSGVHGGSPTANVKVEADATEKPDDGDKTLDDAKFLVGDYISCVILPSLEDGSVAPAASARSGRGSGVGEARAWDDGLGPSPRIGTGRQTGWSDRQSSEGYANISSSSSGWRVGPRTAVFDSGGIGSNSSMPTGEWRRGERLPDGPSGGGRGGRGRGGWSKPRGRR